MGFVKVTYESQRFPIVSKNMWQFRQNMICMWHLAKLKLYLKTNKQKTLW